MKLIQRIQKTKKLIALNQALLDLIGPYGCYYIDVNGIINFNFKNSELDKLDNLEFNLPSIEEIKELAKKKYKNFNDSFVKNIEYYFNLKNNPSMCSNNKKHDQKLILRAKDSYIQLSFSSLESIDIKSEGDVYLNDCFVYNNIQIGSKSIKAYSSFHSLFGGHKLNAEYVEFNSVLLKSNNIDIDSELISFNNSKFWHVDNATIKADVIDLNNSKLQTNNKIEIINNSCEELKGVDAPIIIYNGKDITYSEGIIKPKLRKQFLEQLKELRNNITNNIDIKLKDSVKKQKQNLESKPITKLLKK